MFDRIWNFDLNIDEHSTKIVPALPACFSGIGSPDVNDVQSIPLLERHLKADTIQQLLFCF